MLPNVPWGTNLPPLRTTRGRKERHPRKSPLDKAGHIWVPCTKWDVLRGMEVGEAVFILRALMKGSICSAQVSKNYSGSYCSAPPSPFSGCRFLALSTCIEASAMPWGGTSALGGTLGSVVSAGAALTVSRLIVSLRAAQILPGPLASHS